MFQKNAVRASWGGEGEVVRGGEGSNWSISVAEQTSTHIRA